MSRKQLIWIFASITFILAIVVLYQQYTIQSTNSSIKSVRQQTTTPTGDTSADMIEDIQAIASGETSTTTTGTSVDPTGTVVANNDEACVTSYQALIDRVSSVGEMSDSDAPQGLADIAGLGYCNGSTPKESDFVSISSNGQTLAYDTSISGGALKVDNTVVVPDFIKSCTSDCPIVQAVRTVRSDNKYVVLETSKPRNYQSSFRLISTTNGTTMLFWSALSFVDPVASYAWSKAGHFAFIGSSGRDTHTYLVQPKGFPTNTQIPDETDSPVALSIAGDKLVVLYDRNPTNTDTTDRYTKTYNLTELSASMAATGAATAQ